MISRVRRFAWISLGVLLLLPLGLALLSDLLAAMWVQWIVWLALLALVLSCLRKRQEW